MHKLVITAAVIASALLLTGCGAAQQTGEPAGAARFAAAADETETTSEPTPADPAVDITAPGEVCDPHNLNDIICAAFYPDQAVGNMTVAPRAGEPLASLSDEERIALAHEACEQLEAGTAQDAVSVIETSAEDTAAGRNNNFTLASAGALAYCNDYIALDDSGWALGEYQAMGEAAAKESFANGVPLSR